MTDMICRKTMMRCQTPGMCSPHGGCRDNAMGLIAKLQDARAADKARIAEMEKSLQAAQDRYFREVYGLNNEGDPIGGDPAGGYVNENDRLHKRVSALEAERNELLGLLREAQPFVAKDTAECFSGTLVDRIDTALSKHSPQGKGGGE